MSDLISRQDAVSEIDEWIQRATDNETDMAIKEFLSFLKERIESLPSRLTEYKTFCGVPIEEAARIVQEYNAESKTDGVLEQIRWERDVALKTLEEHGIGFGEEPKTGEWIQKDMCADRFCSECNYAVWDSEAEEYNFCPNCGARMTI